MPVTIYGNSNMPFNMKFYHNNTRTGLSARNNADLWSVSYTKLSTTSILVAQVQLAFKDSVNGEVGFYIKYGTSGQIFDGCSYMESGGSVSGGDDSKQIFQSRITGYTTTGSQTFSIGWNSRDGGSNTPSSIWNPRGDSGDDSRNRAPGSTLVLWEMEP